MTTSSRSAVAPGGFLARGGVLPAALLVLVGLAGCAADTAPPKAAAPSDDPKALAADLDARLDALRRQSEPASDDVIASLERTLREQREKRARVVVAAGTTAAVPAGPGVAPSTAPTGTAPAVVAAASAPSRSAHLTKAQARAASAAAARQAAIARQAATVVTPAPDVEPSAGATALPPRKADAVPLPATAYTGAATVAGPARTPMSRMPESHLPVDELYARARELELQLQVVAAIGLYREASQRGHAPSSQRLMELYADGAPGVARDYRVAVFFKERAVQQGANFDPVWRR